MASYCTRADLYAYGLPRGALPNPGRLAAAVSTANNTIDLEEHGFEDDDVVQLRPDKGGSLPTPLTEGVTYYVIATDDTRFQLAATAGGAAIDLTTAGDRVVVIAPVAYDKAISWASRLIDDMLPAHAVPLSEPYPEIVRATVAELAAGKLLTKAGARSKSLTEMIDAASKRLERWGRGVPLRGPDAPSTRTNKAASASLPYADPRGWNKYGGL